MVGSWRAGVRSENEGDEWCGRQEGRIVSLPPVIVPRQPGAGVVVARRWSGSAGCRRSWRGSWRLAGFSDRADRLAAVYGKVLNRGCDLGAAALEDDSERHIVEDGAVGRAVTRVHQTAIFGELPLTVSR